MFSFSLASPSGPHNMKVLVGIKRALDYAARVRVRPDGSGVDLGGARMSVNPFCEIALEVRQKVFFFFFFLNHAGAGCCIR